MCVTCTRLYVHTYEIIYNHIHTEVRELSQSSSTIYIEVEAESVT